MKFKKHIFICTHDRTGPQKSCGEQHGFDLIAAFRKELSNYEGVAEIRVQKSGCLDMCEVGPSLVVYPEGVFYGNVQLEDVAEIVREHLINDRPVKRLVRG